MLKYPFIAHNSLSLLLLINYYYCFANVAWVYIYGGISQSQHNDVEGNTMMLKATQ